MTAHPLYIAACEADEAFHAAVVKVHGTRRAGDARYLRTMWTTPEIRGAYRVKIEADEAWLAFMRAASRARSAKR